MSIFNTRAELSSETEGAQSLSSSSKQRPPDYFPLSFAQQRLWFLNQLQPDSTAYNVSAVVSLEGDLNVAALERGLREVIRRHESLRTTFALFDEEPVQVIAPAQPFDLHFTDLSGLPHVEQEEELSRAMRGEERHLFDLRTGPLLRARLLRLSPTRHVLSLVMHHIISDGWSMGVLVRELTMLYRAFSAGQPSPLAELPMQYADYAEWQRERLQGERLEAQLRYWRERLEGAPAASELPTDRLRPPVRSDRGARYELRLGRELMHQLKQASRRHEVTLFMLLLAAFKTFLYQYTRQRDLVVGVPIAGRNVEESEPLIGFFVNTLALRTRLDGEMGFAQLLEAVREACIGAYAHQDVPFEMLVERLDGIERSLAQTPLFHVMFALQNAPKSGLGLPGLKMEMMASESQTAKFDLTVYVLEGVEGMVAAFEYNTDLFDHATVERMAVHYRRVLESVSKHPERRLNEVEMLSSEERRRIIHGWNDTAFERPNDITIQQLFERQVERSPHAVALSYEGQHLTYDELNRRANQLAHHLKARGVGPESLVAVSLERSVEMVSALLAVLKAGGAYLPLDPHYPHERLSFMLADAGINLLLTHQRLIQNLPEPTEVTNVITLDSLWPTLADESASNPVRAAHGDNLAYVIYTSGSTGRPKGAMNTHAAICNYLLWMQEHYPLTAADSVLQKTPFSFDVSVREFFWPLINGARLVLAAPEGHKDNAYLARLVAAERITVMHFVPSMLRLFLADERAPESCASVHLVISSGEALPSELARSFRERLPWSELHNLYGPAEAAVEVTHRRCRAEDTDGARELVPIGRPIANTQIHVLDERGEIVPVGVVGELYIGGAAVGRGYVGRAGLTAERFVPDGVSGAAGARLYRTGDKARRLADGEIEYVGRADQQVKVRGFRVELGEIEAVLCSHTSVRECVVEARADHVGEQRLTAYVVWRAPTEGDAEAASANVAELRRYIKERLPEYMMPSAFVRLTEMPLLPNGKVDRRALPPPEETRPESGTRYVAPKGEVQKVITSIWQDVLGVENLGVNDNFFDLGGHSLKMIRAHHKLVRVLDTDLTLVEMFQYPTVSLLSDFLSAREGERPLLRQGSDRAVIRRGMAKKGRRNARGVDEAMK